MELLLIASLVVGVILARAWSRTLLSPLGVFCASWLLVLTVYFTPALGYYPLSDTTLLCVQIMTLGLMGGSLLAARLFPVRRVAPEPLQVSEYHAWSSILLVMLAIGLVGVLVYARFALPDLRLPTQVEVMPMERYGVGANRVYGSLVFDVAVPFLVTVSIASSALHARLVSRLAENPESTTPDARQLRTRLLVIIILAFGSLVYLDYRQLGRIFTVAAIFAIVSAYLCVSPPRARSARALALPLLTILVLAAGVWAVSLWRGLPQRQFHVGQLLLGYYTGGLGYFNSLLAVGRFEDWPRQWGQASLIGFMYFARTFYLLPLARRLVPEYPPYLADRYSSLPIGPNMRYNGFATLMAEPYYDAGFWGVFVLALLIGFLSTLAFHRARQSSSPLVVSLAALAMFWVFWSPMQWTGAAAANSVVPFWLLIAHFLTRLLRKTGIVPTHGPSIRRDTSGSSVRPPTGAARA